MSYNSPFRGRISAAQEIVETWTSGSLPPLEEPGLKGTLARLGGVENCIVLRRCSSESVEEFHKIEEAESESLKERMCGCLGWREKEEMESIYSPATLR